MHRRDTSLQIDMFLFIQTFRFDLNMNNRFFIQKFSKLFFLSCEKIGGDKFEDCPLNIVTLSVEN